MSESEIESNRLACASLTDEHRKAEALLQVLESQLRSLQSEEKIASSERLAMVQDTLDALTQEMDVHFACEEQGLFPVLSRYHPMVLMEVEHEEIIAWRDRLNEQLQKAEDGDVSIESICRAGLRFIEELHNHIAREDVGIFPMAERDLSLQEKQAVIQSMETLRERGKTEIIPPIIREPKNYYRVELDLNSPIQRPITL